MAPKLVRFRVSNVGLDVTVEQLLEALTVQLALEGVSLDAGSLVKSGEGQSQEAEIALPEDEAEVLRGPMSEAKIYVGRTMAISFKEVSPPPRSSKRVADQRASSEIVPSAKALSRNNGRRAGALPRPDVTSGGSTSSSAAAAGHGGPLQPHVTDSGRALGAPRFAPLQVDDEEEVTDDSDAETPKKEPDAEERRELDEARRKVQLHTLRMQIRDDPPSPRAHMNPSRHREQDSRISLGPELALCSRWLSQPPPSSAAAGDPKASRACSTPCTVQ
mmetsp:Transcript_109871/g.309880  ORF Transcript_109871/g.309880 Transcript_109871/m.309880 type:complete len:275 (-) Transcript_109871:206-1030(-)